MAGKKNRKRQTGSKKKVSKQNENDGSVSVEEKKAKLDDGLEEQAEQSGNCVQQPNLESPTVADTNNDLSKDSGDLQSEESKYVPPFTRKSKKTLQRDRLSSVSPDVKSARPKRPWKGKRNSKETQQSLADQQTNDMICAKDSPKMGEEGKEQHMDVQGLEEVMICTQGKNSAVVFSTSQNSADELAVTTDEVISSSILATAREEISNIVMLVIDNVFEAMYQPITQCNNSEITAEFKEPKTSAEETETQSIVNIDIQVTDSSKEVDEISEAELKPSIDTAVKPVTILTKAALKKTFTGKTAKRCKVMAGSESKTTTLKQQQNQATTNKQQHTTVEAHAHSTQETATSEGALKKCDSRINHGDETLENDNKGKLPCSPHQNENKNRVMHQENSATDNEPGSQNYTVTSRGEISANDSDAEPKNLGIEGSPITTLEVNHAVSFNNAISSVNEELRTLSTSPIPTNKDLNSTDICSANHVSEKEHHQHRAIDDLFKSDGQTKMANTCKSNMDTPMLEKEVSSTVDSGNCGENANNMCQIDIEQDLDQMVPDNCETTTVMLQENPDVDPFTVKPKRKEIGLEVSAGVSSEQQCSPHVGERKHECQDIDEQMDKIPIVKTGTTRKMNESCQESPQLLTTSTAQASVVCVDQGPVTHGLLTMDKTVTCTKSLLHSESFCKHDMETVEQDQKMENEIAENQSSKVEAGCSLFGFDSDILEFDSLMDCTDSQLVHVDDSSDENLLPESHKHDARQLLNSNGAENSTSNGSYCSVEVPSDKGMIKGLISELSALNKFIMGACKDLENQKKRRHARLKLGKMKKLK